jgi:hypothetical protein
MQLAFNDLRDNEQRGARHRQRANCRLQALTISSLQSRFAETPQPQVTPAAISQLSGITVKACTFDPVAADASPLTLKFDPDHIISDRTGWESTKPDAFTSTQQALVCALLLTNEMVWTKLWIASLYRAHMIISDRDHLAKDRWYYVLEQTQWSLVVLELDEAGGVLRFNFTATAPKTALTLNAKFRHSPTTLHSHVGLILFCFAFLGCTPPGVGVYFGSPVGAS